MREIRKGKEIVHIDIDKEEVFNEIMRLIKNKEIKEIPEEITLIDSLTEKDVFVKVKDNLTDLQKYTIQIALTKKL